MDEDVSVCWRCGSEIGDCCCGEKSPLNLTEAVDIFNELHLRGALDEFETLYPNKIEELDFDED